MISCGIEPEPFGVVAQCLNQPRYSGRTALKPSVIVRSVGIMGFNTRSSQYQYCYTVHIRRFGSTTPGCCSLQVHIYPAYTSIYIYVHIYNISLCSTEEESVNRNTAIYLYMYIYIYILREVSPRANYTDRATASCWRS
jgi:hypothetical protein